MTLYVRARKYSHVSWAVVAVHVEEVVGDVLELSVFWSQHVDPEVWPGELELALDGLDLVGFLPLGHLLLAPSDAVLLPGGAAAGLVCGESGRDPCGLRVVRGGGHGSASPQSRFNCVLLLVFWYGSSAQADSSVIFLCVRLFVFSSILFVCFTYVRLSVALFKFPISVNFLYGINFLFGFS